MGADKNANKSVIGLYIVFGILGYWDIEIYRYLTKKGGRGSVHKALPLPSIIYRSLILQDVIL